MKQLITLTSLLIFAASLPGCKQNKTEKPLKSSREPVSDTGTSNKPEKSPKKKTTESQIQGSSGHFSEFEKAKEYALTDTILADFNGDGFLDNAFYKKENETSGIIIRHGRTREEVRIGFGKDFSTWTEFNCNWLDYWGLVEDRETTEVTFTEEGDVLEVKTLTFKILPLLWVQTNLAADSLRFSTENMCGYTKPVNEKAISQDRLSIHFRQLVESFCLIVFCKLGFSYAK